MIFDSHCHLDPNTYGGDAGVDAVVETARAAGVTRMLTVGAGYGHGTAARSVAVAERHEGIWASVGVHPHDAALLDDTGWDELRGLAARPKVVAWGEIGLDFFYDHSPRDTQRRVFREQIRVARDLDLPIIIHDRDSDGECLRVLDEEGAFEGGVLYHCYAGDVAQMEELVGRGAVISIPGVVTYKKAAEMQAVAAQVPGHAYLVETDAPFLTPEPLRGRRNEPCHTALTVDAVARLRQVDAATVARETWENASRFFGLPVE
ncbi:MAG: TatD family hydrolase [Proteobacteria bacterium]|nr:TatD family hydrolase [Pseudomonadota bacterium]MCP4919732.1 TatD family hydrolase [Pseudomonadota bacterium]